MGDLDVRRLAELAGCSTPHLRTLLLADASTLQFHCVIDDDDDAHLTEPLHVDVEPPRVTTALVTAAHRPSPLDTGALPKELIEFSGRALVVHCIEQLVEAGMRRVIVVVAHQGQLLVDEIERAGPWGVELEFVRLPAVQCHAASIVAARHRLPDPFVLVTGDHVFLPELVRRVASTPLDGEAAGVVLVESHLGRLDTLPATGVLAATADGRVVDIGRRGEVARPDSVEAGLMLLSRPVLESLIDLQCTEQYYSLAQALRPLARGGRLLAASA